MDTQQPTPESWKPSPDELAAVREANKRPQDTVKLEGDVPLYHALLPDAPVVSATDTLNAKQRLDTIVIFDRNAVSTCQGQTAEAARGILEGIEARMMKEDKREAA